MKVKIYKTEDGKEPYWKWYLSVRSKDKKTARRIRSRLRKAEQGNFGEHRSFSKGLYELKLDFGPGYRVYLGRRGNEFIILLCGGAKKTQGKDIKQAEVYWEDYKKRVKNG